MRPCARMERDPLAHRMPAILISRTRATTSALRTSQASITGIERRASSQYEPTPDVGAAEDRLAGGNAAVHGNRLCLC